MVADGFPSGGNHQAPGLGLGPDGRLYLTLGSTCNACEEASPERAAMLVLENGSRRVYASGLRNTMGFDWQPATGDLYGADQGVDLRGDDLPPEEVNRHPGRRPLRLAVRLRRPQVPDRLTPFDPPGTTKEAFAATTEPSVLDLPAHASPIQLRFYNGTAFPAEYRGDAFVTLHGSWNRNPPNGYPVARLRFSAAGEPEGYDDFLAGFLYDGNRVFGRPAGLAVLPDGALLVGDDFNGVVYRVAYAAALMTASARRAGPGTCPRRGPPAPGRPSGTRPSPSPSPCSSRSRCSSASVGDRPSRAIALPVPTPQGYTR